MHCIMVGNTDCFEIARNSYLTEFELSGLHCSTVYGHVV